MYCTNCGAKLENEARFCSSCGTAVGDAVEPVTLRANGSNVFEGAIKAGKKKPVYAIIAVVALFVIIVVIASLRSEPADTVYAFVDAVNNKDLKTAIEYLDPATAGLIKVGVAFLAGTMEMQPGDVLEAVPGLFALARGLGSKADFHIEVNRIISQEITGDSATVKAEFTMITTDDEGNSKIETGIGTIYLKKFGDEWRIMGST